MIEVHDVAVHAVTELEDGRRTLLVVARVNALAGGSASLGLTVELRSAAGTLLAVVNLDPQPVPPGASLVEWARTVHVPTGAAQARWVADAATTLAGPLWTEPVGGTIGDQPRPPRTPAPVPTSVAPSAPEPARRSARPRAPALPAAPAAPPPPAPDRFTDAVRRPWDEVADQFAPDSLDIAGRDRVRAMLKSDDPAEVTAGCRIATATGWRTTVQAMRRLLDHPDAQIRAVAATGIGALAGPAMEHLLRRRVEQDPDPAVQAAAQAGIAAIASRSRR